MNDNVKAPSHYTQGKYETIDIVRETLGKERFEGFCVGNILKYVIRYQHKNGLEDLEKAEVYLKWAIEVLEDEG